MNDSLWWDELDGDSLVCRPGNEGDAEFALICLFATRIMPAVLLGFGFCFLYMAWLQNKLTRNIQPTVPQGKSTNNTPSQNTAEMMFRKSKQTASSKAKGNHGAKLAFVLGVVTACQSLLLLMNGHGTVFPSDSLPGRIGDGLDSIYCCLIWYLALIQVRGAKWFKELVQLPTGNNNTSKGKQRFSLPSATQLLDSVQERFGPFLALTLWVLLAVGILARGWFYFINYTLTASFGLRAFLAIATQRVSALRKVALMQNAANGTAADKKRRKGILKNKTYALVIDLTCVCILIVIFPYSVVIIGSTFSSRQMVLHYVVMLPFILLGAWLLIVAMYAGIIETKKQRLGRTRFRTANSTVASEHSAFSVAIDANDQRGGEALFSSAPPD